MGRAAARSASPACRARASSSTISTTADAHLPSAAAAARFVDLPPISARGLTAAEVDDAIRDASTACDGGIDDKIVRLVVRDLPRHIARELDHKALREFKRRALHFHLDTRRPEIDRAPPGIGAPGGGRRSRDIVRDKLRERAARRGPRSRRARAARPRYLKQADERRSGVGVAAAARGRRCASTASASANFRQHADTRIDFDSRAHGHHRPERLGQVDDPRGDRVGALRHDRGARHARVDSLQPRRRRARTVRVELDFELGGHRYRVVRGLTNAELYLDGAAAPIANSITGVTELLTRRLGMTRDEFFNTYFTGQKELSVMAAMGPSERAQFLSRVLGYERLRTAQQLVRERTRIDSRRSRRHPRGDAGPGERRAACSPTRERRLRRRRDSGARARASARRARRRRSSASRRAGSAVQREREQLAGAARRAARRRRARQRSSRATPSALGARARRDRRRRAPSLTRSRVELAPLRRRCTRSSSASSGSRARRAVAARCSRRERALDDELRRLRERRREDRDGAALEEEVTLALREKRRDELELVDGRARGAPHRVGARPPGGGDEARRRCASSTRS